MGVWSIRRGLAIFALILYCFDSGSDVFVSVDLIFLKCHVRYGLTVFAFILLPGFMYGWWKYRRSEFNFFQALTCPLWYCPYSVKKLFDAIKNSTPSGGPSSYEEDEAKR